MFNSANIKKSFIAKFNTKGLLAIWQQSCCFLSVKRQQSRLGLGLLGAVSKKAIVTGFLAGIALSPAFMSHALAKGINAVELGGGLAEGNSSVAIGGGISQGEGSSAIGIVSQALGRHTTAFGAATEASRDFATAIGVGAKAYAAESLAVGYATEVRGKKSVALGNGSIANQDNTVSVGNEGHERTITNVADGELSETSTDAVTGKQLYETNEYVERLKATLFKNFMLLNDKLIALHMRLTTLNDRIDELKK